MVTCAQSSSRHRHLLRCQWDRLQFMFHSVQANQCRGAETAAEQASIDPPPLPLHHPTGATLSALLQSFHWDVESQLMDRTWGKGGWCSLQLSVHKKTNICSEYAEMSSDKGNCYSWVKGKRLLEAASGLAAARWAKHQSRSAALTQNSDSVRVGGWQISPPAPPPPRERNSDL